MLTKKEEGRTDLKNFRRLCTMIDIWVTYKAKAWLQNWLKRSHVGFEFGSGYSTIWLGQRVKFLTSVEYQLKWYKKIHMILKKYRLNNVKLLYEPNLKFFPMVIRRCYNATLDFVFVDGRERVRCVQRSYIKVKPGGILILDNSERPRYHSVFELLKNWSRLDFKGAGRGGRWQTSVWIKPKIYR